MASDLSDKRSIRTFKYRATSLLHAGLRFGDFEKDLRDVPDVETLITSLRDTKQLLSVSQIAEFGDVDEIPLGVPTSGPGMAKSTFKLLLTAARHSKKTSKVPANAIDQENEAGWRRDCHDAMLPTLATACEELVKVYSKQELRPLNLDKVYLGPSRPAYIWAVPISVSIEKLTAQLLGRLTYTYIEAVSSCGPQSYMNSSQQMFFPVVCAESKSLQSTPIEAENQCAEGSIKMARTLRNWVGLAQNLPIFSMSLLGSRVTVYVTVSKPSAKFIMCAFWRRDLQNLWEGFRFQLILFRIGLWTKDTALVTINESLAVYDQRVRALQSLPPNA